MIWILHTRRESTFRCILKVNSQPMISCHYICSHYFRDAVTLDRNKMTMEIILRWGTERLCPASSFPTARRLSSGIIALTCTGYIYSTNWKWHCLLRFMLLYFWAWKANMDFRRKIMAYMKYLRNMYACVIQLELDWSRVFRLSVFFSFSFVWCLSTCDPWSASWYQINILNYKIPYSLVKNWDPLYRTDSTMKVITHVQLKSETRPR